MISGGPYWGQHAVLVGMGGLQLLALVALGRDLGGTWRAGWLAGLLGVCLGAYERQADWNAWIGTAGETAFGLWGLWAANRTLRHAAWAPLAALLMVGSGLHKEPGWFVYPGAAFFLAVPVARDPQTRRRGLLVMGLVLLGVLGFAWAWHPANVLRAEQAKLPVVARIADFLRTQPIQFADGFPFWEGRSTARGSGIWVGLLALALTRDLLGPAALSQRSGALVWLYAALGLVGLSWALPTAAPLGFVLLLTLALLRRLPALPPGLALAALGMGVMILFEKPSEVQIISAGYGLALHTALALDAALTAAVARWLTLAVGVGLAVQGGRLVQRMVTPPEMSTYQAQREVETQYLGYSALARTLRTSEVQIGALNSQEQEGLPLVGLRQVSPKPGGTTPSVSCQGELLFSPGPKVLEDTLLKEDVIHGRSLPIVKDTSDHADWPGLATTPGFYALGIAVASGGTPQMSLQAMDACDRLWKVEREPTLPVPFSVLVIDLPERCSPVRLAWVGEGDDPGAIAFLAPLLEPQQSIWFPIPIERRLEVNPDKSIYTGTGQ